MTKKTILDVKEKLDRLYRKQMKQRHSLEVLKLKQKEGIEQAYKKELDQFYEYWDSKMKEFEAEAMKIEDEMIIHHQESLKTYETKILESFPEKGKQSAEILNLKKIEAELVKQKEYMEAHIVQNQEKECEERWKSSKEFKLKSQLDQLRIRQANELAALRQKIDLGKDEQRKARETGLEHLKLRYSNVKKELELQQLSEISKFEKNTKNACKFAYEAVVALSKMHQSKMNSTMRSFQADKSVQK